MSQSKDDLIYDLVDLHFQKIIETLIESFQAGNTPQDPAEMFRTALEMVLFQVVKQAHGQRVNSRDVTQEVFFRVYRGLPGFRKGAGFVPWLYTIAANVARNRWRKREMGEVFPAGEGFSLEELSGDQPTPEEAWEEKEVRQTVEKAVAALLWLALACVCLLGKKPWLPWAPGRQRFTSPPCWGS